MKIANILKRPFCSHLSQDLVFIRNIHGDEINHLNARSIWYCNKCGKVVYSNQLYNTDNISDGYHTFGELYDHRSVLTAVVANFVSSIYGTDRCWKSWKHHDGTMYDKMFIVGIETPEGTATYHYSEDYWNLFKVSELECAPEWDGHTSDDAICRISSLLTEELPKNFLTAEELARLVELQKSLKVGVSEHDSHCKSKTCSKKPRKKSLRGLFIIPWKLK